MINDSPKTGPKTKTETKTEPKTGTDLAREMLDRQQSADNQQPSSTAAGPAGTDEAADSDELAETLTALQNVIERGAQQLESVSRQLREKRDSLGNVFANDQELEQAREQAQLASQQAKQRQTSLQADPQVTALQVQIGELKEQQQELKETLSNHLVNYYQLTNSKSFDTSDGDQWEFEVKARVKPRRKAKN
ncbi:MAG: hypothetical protein COU69_03255 [Candidatus Pacebacteria bacterium CG10_big_fil_rev_8_21_14_0_10_56_10]|nr:MAG: hypothetical protein COU69_03255 [Candidatus Pacebacteria bacterium CG10_big_fil_rev_8_21_14_0_10_56_10]